MTAHRSFFFTILLTAFCICSLYTSCTPTKPTLTRAERNFNFCWDALRIFTIFQDKLPSDPHAFTDLSSLYASVGDQWTVYYGPDSAYRYIAFLNRSVIAKENVSSRTTVFTDSLDTAIAYIRINGFSDSTIDSQGTMGEFHQALAQTAWADVTIIDLRHNPGGIVPQCIAVAGEFVRAGTKIALAHERQYDQSAYPNGITRDTTWTTNRTDGLGITRKFYLLVDSYTASAAELVTITIKQYRADVPIIGTRTYGKARAQEVWYPTPDSGMAKVTYSLLRPYSGDPYDLVGIVPTTQIPASMDALRVAVNMIRGGVLAKQQGDSAAIAGISSRVYRREKVAPMAVFLHDPALQ